MAQAASERGTRAGRPDFSTARVSPRAGGMRDLLVGQRRPRALAHNQGARQAGGVALGDDAGRGGNGAHLWYNHHDNQVAAAGNQRGGRIHHRHPCPTDGAGDVFQRSCVEPERVRHALARKGQHRDVVGGGGATVG